MACVVLCGCVGLRIFNSTFFHDKGVVKESPLEHLGKGGEMGWG